MLTFPLASNASSHAQHSVDPDDPDDVVVVVGAAVVVVGAAVVVVQQPHVAHEGGVFPAPVAGSGQPCDCANASERTTQH